MNKLIFVTVLLVAVSGARAEEWDDETIKNCFDGDMAKLSKVEVPAEIKAVDEHLASLGGYTRWTAEVETYRQSLSEEEKAALVEAANKFVAETSPIFHGPCTEQQVYSHWIYRNRKQAAQRKYLDLERLAQVARYIKSEP